MVEAGSPQFLQPSWADSLFTQVILPSASLRNCHSLPSPETLEAEQRYALLHNDRNGRIGLRTDVEQK